ncbi:uncharacterized protein LOC135962853 [Calliphora vicina]|uniref:uncharacterized protein LOC135962853 n=1 Tax=Calliphora vicina TaxID=7373 RepID=UPI00325B7D41
MNDEQLILLVQANESLCNKYSSGYKLADKKKRIWTEIAEQMQLPDEMCIKRWGCLRDRFAKEKRMENLPSGSGSKYKSQWPLLQTMDFISPHIIPRPTRCSVNILDSTYTCLEISPSPESQSSSPSLPTVETILEECVEISSPNIPIAPKRKRKGTENTDVDQSFVEAVEVFKSLCESTSGKKKEEEKDPLIGFSKMIIATIATMHSKKQIETIQKVTALVMEMKLKPDN